MSVNESDIVGLAEEAAALEETCKVYEFPEVMEEATKVVADCKSDLESIRVAWGNAEKIASTFARFNDTLWSEVQAEDMEGSEDALTRH